MTPSVWGPMLWNLLFSCAWNATDEDVESLKRLLLILVPRLLPCKTCRFKCLMNLQAVTNTVKIETPESAFLWIYNLKNAVNRETNASPLAVERLMARYRLHDGILFNVWMAADIIVLVAIEAEKNKRKGECTQLCAIFGALLPECLAKEFTNGLIHLSEKSLVDDALALARRVRQMNNLAAKSMEEYKKLGNI